ncbi:MAG: GtrA family protein [Thermoleophilaceae bacterium]|nr:GtrA family protein [Thermoleophilaceae bacterium]
MNADSGAGQLMQFVRFVVVGATNTLIYFVIYVVLIAVGVPYVIASVLAFAVSAFMGYTMHRLWTFGSGDFDRTEFVRWLVLQGTTTLANVLTLAFAVGVLGLGKIVGQLIILPFIPLWTYLISRRWIFSEQGTQGGHDTKLSED